MSERSPTKHVLRMQIRIRGHIPDCTRHVANSVSVGAIVINIFLSKEIVSVRRDGVPEKKT